MDYVYGDTSGKLTGQQEGDSDIMLASLDSMYLVGDASLLTGVSVGGNDGILGYYNSDPEQSGNIVNVLIGDALTMTGYSTGGNDYLMGGGFTDASLLGDAYSMDGNSRGGADVLLAGFGSQLNFLYGDAYTMKDSSVGGDDVLQSVHDSLSVNYLYGDAYQGAAASQGGNDVLLALGGTDYLWGDFRDFVGDSTDRSHFGQDVFYFSDNSGNDIVFDFYRGEDKIDLTAKNISGLDQFSMTQDAGNLVLSFTNNASTITLIGVDTLDAADFILLPQP